MLRFPCLDRTGCIRYILDADFDCFQILRKQLGYNCAHQAIPKCLEKGVRFRGHAVLSERISCSPSHSDEVRTSV